MASFIFEEGTQASATSFTGNDQLIFKTATPATLGVTYTPAANLAQNDTITLTLGTFSLTFAATALANNTKLTFLAGGTLVFGDNVAGDLALTAAGATTSAVYALGGADSVTLNGAGGHIVDGGTGNDTISVLSGGAGNYVISGGGSDTAGAGGADSINAANATGNLHIYGNAFGSVAGAVDGNDTITVGHGATATAVATNYVNGNGGDDSITVAAGGFAGDNYRIFGGGGNDTINLGAGVAGQIYSVNGNAGNDTITGSLGGFDTLRGGAGDDVINMGNGAGQAFGDAGNDKIAAGVGSAAVNILTGGTGNDTFIFNLNSASSIHISPTATPADPDGLFGYVTEIKDFTSGADKIDLLQVAGTGTAATTSTNTTVNILLQATGTTFTNAQAAANYAQQILDNAGAETGNKHNIALINVGSDTYLFSHDNSAGAGQIDTAIKLDGVTAANVKATDFI
jgi:serralysin